MRIVSIVGMGVLALCSQTGPLSAGVSYEGTSKGCVMAHVKSEPAEFQATREAGPWSKEEQAAQPTVAVLALCSADETNCTFVSSAATHLRTILSKEPTVRAIPKEATDDALKPAGFSSVVKWDDAVKALGDAVCSYDLVASTQFYNGWLTIRVYRAVSKTRVLVHRTSIYFGANPAVDDLSKFVELKYVMGSVETLQKEK